MVLNTEAKQINGNFKYRGECVLLEYEFKKALLSLQNELTHELLNLIKKN